MFISTGGHGGHCRRAGLLMMVQSWLPNPVWLGQTPDELVELQRTLLGLTEAGSHWDLSHRGLEVGSSGWAFVGREVTLQQIVAWLEFGLERRACGNRPSPGRGNRLSWAGW